MSRLVLAAGPGCATVFSLERAGKFVDMRVRRSPALGYAVSGECSFLVLMLSCCAIEPSWFAVKRGLSYYGNSVTTVVPYGAAFALSIVLTAFALARIEPRNDVARRFRRAVGGVLVLTAAVPLTPYAVDVIFDWLHIGVTTALFSSGLVLGGWIALRLRDRVAVAFYLVESAAGLTIVAGQVGLNDYMIPSELIFQAAAFALVAWGIRRLAPDPQPVTRPGESAVLRGLYDAASALPRRPPPRAAASPARPCAAPSGHGLAPSCALVLTTLRPAEIFLRAVGAVRQKTRQLWRLMKKPCLLSFEQVSPSKRDVQDRPSRRQVWPYRSTRERGSIAVSPWQTSVTRPSRDTSIESP